MIRDSRTWCVLVYLLQLWDPHHKPPTHMPSGPRGERGRAIESEPLGLRGPVKVVLCLLCYYYVVVKVDINTLVLC